MKYYKTDISVARVGITTAPKIPSDHPNVRFSSCLHREVFGAADITEARQQAIARVENPSIPEFQKCLDFYAVPFKTLQWQDWADPIEPEGETQIHSCESQPFLNGVFKWIVKILLYGDPQSARIAVSDRPSAVRGMAVSDRRSAISEEGGVA